MRWQMGTKTYILFLNNVIAGAAKMLRELPAPDGFEINVEISVEVVPIGEGKEVVTFTVDDAVDTANAVEEEICRETRDQSDKTD